MKKTIVTVATLLCGLLTSAATTRPGTIDFVKAIAALDAFQWPFKTSTAGTQPVLIKPLVAFRNEDMADVPREYVAPAEHVIERLGSRSWFKVVATSGSPRLHAVRYDERATVVITGVGIDRVYNTLRMSEKERAADVFSTAVVPFVHAAAGAFASTPATYYGIAVAFLSRDASESYETPAGESLLVLVPRALAKKFDAGEITDAALAEGSIVLLKPADAQEFTRVALQMK